MREILDRYERPLVAYATGIAGNVETAREIVQDVFLRLCREEAVQRNGRLPQWLYTVCRNRALDVRKKNRRMATVGTDRLDDRPASGSDRAARSDSTTGSYAASASDPAVIVEKRERSGLVRQATDRLPPDQREVIELRFRHELSYKDIAAVTGHSVGNVGFLIHTAVKAIRERMVGT